MCIYILQAAQDIRANELSQVHLHPTSSNARLIDCSSTPPFGFVLPPRMTWTHTLGTRRRALARQSVSLRSLLASWIDTGKQARRVRRSCGRKSMCVCSQFVSLARFAVPFYLQCGRVPLLPCRLLRVLLVGPAPYADCCVRYCSRLGSAATLPLLLFAPLTHRSDGG